MRSPLHKGSHTPHPKSAGDAKTNSLEVCIMPKPKWNLNTIYISERLQESLRPISRCAMTTVVAPMGYGKTTAVNWYLGEHAKAEALHIIRISVYSDTLRFSGRAFRRRLPAQGSTFCGSIPAQRTRQAAGCWWTISAICWRANFPVTSSLTIFIC